MAPEEEWKCSVPQTKVLHPKDVMRFGTQASKHTQNIKFLISSLTSSMLPAMPSPPPPPPPPPHHHHHYHQQHLKAYIIMTRKWLVCVCIICSKIVFFGAQQLFTICFYFCLHFALPPPFISAPPRHRIHSVCVYDELEHHENVQIRLFMCLLHAYWAFNVYVCAACK